jgi:hypothetical protein
MSREDLPLGASVDIICQGFRLTNNYSSNKILTSDNNGYGSWQTIQTGTNGQITIIINEDTILPNTSANVIINSGDDIDTPITITLPESPVENLFYYFTQMSNCKVILKSISHRIKINYIKIEDSTFHHISQDDVVFIPNSSEEEDEPSILYNLIYDSSRSTWKSLSLGSMSDIIAISNTSTLVTNRNYAMYEERNTTPLTLTLTNTDNTGRVYSNKNIQIQSNNSNVDLKKNNQTITSADTNDNGVLIFNAASNSSSSYNATITCSYDDPTELNNNTSSLVIAFSYDDSTLVADKTTIAANGTDYATITATIKDASDNLYNGKLLEIKDDGEDVVTTPSTGTTNTNGEAVFQVSSNIIQANVTVSCSNNTNDYIISPTLSLSFVNADIIGSYGSVYAWYHWSNYDFDTNKWLDHYGNNSNGNAIGTPSISDNSLQFSKFSSGYDFSGNAKLPSRGVYFIRAKKTNVFDTSGRIINGSGMPYVTNGGAGNNLLGWHTWGIGWAYLAQGSSVYPSDIAFGVAFSNDGMGGRLYSTEWNIFVYRASDPNTQHCWVYTPTGLIEIPDVGDQFNGDWDNTIPTYYTVNSGLPEEKSDCAITDFLIYNNQSDISDSDVLSICEYLTELNS